MLMLMLSMMLGCCKAKTAYLLREEPWRLELYGVLAQGSRVMVVY